MSEAKHTKEPWKVVKPCHGHNTGYRCVQIGKDSLYTTLEMFPEDAERIVACVNGCDGINPAAVQDLLAACKAAALAMFCQIQGSNEFNAALASVETAIEKAEQ